MFTMGSFYKKLLKDEKATIVEAVRGVNVKTDTGKSLVEYYTSEKFLNPKPRKEATEAQKKSAWAKATQHAVDANNISIGLDQYKTEKALINIQSILENFQATTKQNLSMDNTGQIYFDNGDTNKAGYPVAYSKAAIRRYKKDGFIPNREGRLDYINQRAVQFLNAYKAIRTVLKKADKEERPEKSEQIAADRRAINSLDVIKALNGVRARIGKDAFAGVNTWDQYVAARVKASETGKAKLMSEYQKRADRANNWLIGASVRNKISGYENEDYMNSMMVSEEDAQQQLQQQQLLEMERIQKQLTARAKKREEVRQPAQRVSARQMNKLQALQAQQLQ